MAGTITIPLSKDQVAIVDKEDFKWLSGMGKWTLHGEGYAYRWDRTVKPNRCLLMHRVIMGHPYKQDIDHINRDKLDNRRINLRVVSRSANSLNKITAGVEGSTHWSGYVIRLKADKTRLYIGRFKDREEAMHISTSIKEQLLKAIL